MTTKAVFFDVDFTLIYPGPAFQGTGYRDFCAEHDVTVDALAFESAVKAASTLLDTNGDVYDPEIFIQYTARIIEHMGGCGEGVERAARRIYDEWSSCHHFEMYEDVPEVLRELHAAATGTVTDRLGQKSMGLPLPRIVCTLLWMNPAMARVVTSAAFFVATTSAVVEFGAGTRAEFAQVPSPGAFSLRSPTWSACMCESRTRWIVPSRGSSPPVTLCAGS